MSQADIVYVDAYDYQEFQNFQEEHKDLNCIYIADENFLRARTPGLIKRIGRFEKRWNWHPITEAIERAYRDWEEFFKDKELDEELSKTGLTEEDLEYGIE